MKAYFSLTSWRGSSPGRGENGARAGGGGGQRAGTRRGGGGGDAGVRSSARVGETVEGRRGGRGGGTRVARATRGRFPNRARNGKWEGNQRSPGNGTRASRGRRRKWGGRRAPWKTSCRSKRRGYSRDGWSGAVVSWPPRAVAAPEGKNRSRVVARCRAVGRRTPRPNKRRRRCVCTARGARFPRWVDHRAARGDRPAAPCASHSSSWRTRRRPAPRARRARSFSR